MRARGFSEAPAAGIMKAQYLRGRRPFSSFLLSAPLMSAILTLIVSCVAGASAALRGKNPWLFPAVFVTAAAACLLLMLLFLAACSLFVKDPPREKRFPFYRRLLAETARLVFRLGRVSLVTEGLEKLPAGGCMIAQNHLASFDPFALYIALSDAPLAFVSKQENLALPLAGRLMAGAGVIGLDRADNRQGALVIRKAAERIQGGQYLCIYPEGTRSKTGALGPFRNGCFKAALWAKAPLAVVTAAGTDKIRKNFFIRKTVVTLSVKRVFSYEEIASLTTDRIGALVREEMER